MLDLGFDLSPMAAFLKLHTLDETNNPVEIPGSNVVGARICGGLEHLSPIIAAISETRTGMVSLITRTIVLPSPTRTRRTRTEMELGMPVKDGAGLPLWALKPIQSRFPSTASFSLQCLSAVCFSGERKELPQDPKLSIDGLTASTQRTGSFETHRMPLLKSTS